MCGLYLYWGGEMNNKSQIELFIAVLLAFASCILVLGAFLYSSLDFSNNSKIISDIIAENQASENYVIQEATFITGEAIRQAKDLGEEEIKNKIMKIAEANDLRLINLGNFFGKMRNKEFQFYTLQNKKGYALEVDELFVESKTKGNKMHKDFDLYIEFDNSGKIIRFINKSK